MKWHLRVLAVVWLSCQVGLGSLSLLLAQPGVTQEGPLTVLRTGGELPLVTSSNAFEVPDQSTLPRLRFDFGFATDEPDAVGTFFDAFSVTLQSGDGTATALLLTADRTGAEWAPPNTGGLSLEAGQVKHTESVFANVSPDLSLKTAFSVTYTLAAELAGRLVNLFFDLFDNLNAAVSLAYVRDVRIETSGSGPWLYSATAAAGPYTEESGAVLDVVSQTLSIDRPTGHRFFRVLADELVQIARIRVVNSQLEIEYAYLDLKLYSAAAVEGPYLEETGAVLDAVNRTFTIPHPADSRYYRISAGQPVRIVETRVEGGQLVLQYAFSPLHLFSAANIRGPYSEERKAVLDELQQTFSVGKPLTNRFYRIVSERPVRIVGFGLQGDRLVLHYTFPQLKLHSAAVVQGPYAEELGAVWDEIGQRFFLSEPVANRFYRVYADVPVRIFRLRVVSGRLTLDYEFLP